MLSYIKLTSRNFFGRIYFIDLIGKMNIPQKLKTYIDKYLIEYIII